MSSETCALHPHVTLTKFCPACRASVSSASKTLNARKNGQKGGRPPKKVKGKVLRARRAQ